MGSIRAYNNADGGAVVSIRLPLNEAAREAIIANARKVVLVADSTKFERTAPVRIAHLEQVDVFVTDSCPAANIRRTCAEKDIELVETTQRT